MNALLRAIRFLLAQREKVLLGVMILLCATTAALAFRQRQGEQSANPAISKDEVIVWDGQPREEITYPPAALENERPLDESSRFLDRRPSVFRPHVGGPGPGRGVDEPEPWPEFIVRQVSQPTPGGAWIAQVEVGGRAYIVKEGRRFANQFELQRIDKTRLCVEVLRTLDDAVREFCKE